MSCTSEPPVIELRNVSKLYRIQRERARSFMELFLSGARVRRQKHAHQEIWALRDLNVGVRRGETVGVVGPNGAGKSTILQLVAQVLVPTSGQVITRGRVSSLLELGAGFHPELTGRENVFLYGSLLGISRHEMTRRFDEIVDFSGIGSAVDMAVKRYSSGMYLRLAFSVAIHVEPDILLIDEILAVGDQAFQERCLQRIEALQEQQVTILLVTHNLDVARKVCSRALWIDHGVLRADDSPERIADWYEEAVSQRDLFPGIVEEKGRRWGTRDVEITRVHLVDELGQACDSVCAGGPLHVQIEFAARRRVERPVFGLAIYRNDGIHINGPNTRFAGLEIESIYGSGKVEYRVERLPLLPGRYDLSVSVYDWNCLHSFDHWHRGIDFTVDRGQITELYGLIWMDAQWRLESGGTMRESG